MNKGAKQIWDDGVVDCKYVKYKKSHSVTTEQMDEEFTLKTKYPNVYNEIVQTPLNRTIFKKMNQNDDICTHFTLDPTKGFLTFSIYPENLNQIQNVITKILSSN